MKWLFPLRWNKSNYFSNVVLTFNTVPWVLARKDRILGPYYHRKLSKGMPARKAKVACMRKLVKLLYGAAKSSQQFNPERVYRSAG